jgi:hypothetical protein
MLSGSIHANTAGAGVSENRRASLLSNSSSPTCLPSSSPIFDELFLWRSPSPPQTCVASPTRSAAPPHR